jgi:hypothetical protein
MRPEDIAGRQYGLVTNDEAIGTGLTEHQLRHRRRSGRWLAPRRGVNSIVGVPPSWEQQVLASVLTSGPSALASHSTGARLDGFLLGDIGAIELTTDRDRRVRLEGVVAHRSVHLFDEDRARRAGIPCTSTARVLVDLSTRVDPPLLGKALDEALRRRKLRLVDLHRCIGRLPPAPGRSPSVIHSLLASRWPGYDPGDSDLETRVLRVIAAAGLPMPRQQFRVTVSGRRFRLDLAYPEHMIAIECDGWDVHRTRTAFDADRTRDLLLTRAGWTVLRFTSEMPDELILASVRAALGFPVAS